MNVYKIDLNGINFIEASAGTGKTYSLSILVLRFILENYGDEDAKDVL